MIYCVSIGGVLSNGWPIGAKQFDTGELYSWERVTKYCENEYGFKGDEWEYVKDEYDYEGLEEFLESKGIVFRAYDDE